MDLTAEIKISENVLSLFGALYIATRAVHNFFARGRNQEENCLTFFEIVESVAV